MTSPCTPVPSSLPASTGAPPAKGAASSTVIAAAVPVLQQLSSSLLRQAVASKQLRRVTDELKKLDDSEFEDCQCDGRALFTAVENEFTLAIRALINSHAFMEQCPEADLRQALLQAGTLQQRNTLDFMLSHDRFMGRVATPMTFVEAAENEQVRIVGALLKQPQFVTKLKQTDLVNALVAAVKNEAVFTLVVTIPGITDSYRVFSEEECERILLEAVAKAPTDTNVYHLLSSGMNDMISVETRGRLKEAARLRGRLDIIQVLENFSPVIKRKSPG